MYNPRWDTLTPMQVSTDASDVDAPNSIAIRGPWKKGPCKYR